jgi:hypothetical protein
MRRLKGRYITSLKRRDNAPRPAGDLTVIGPAIAHASVGRMFHTELPMGGLRRSTGKRQGMRARGGGGGCCGGGGGNVLAGVALMRKYEIRSGCGMQH